MYEAADDPYCYPGTTALKNKLGLKKQGDLDEFEAEISLERSFRAASFRKTRLSSLLRYSPASFPGRLHMGRQATHRSYLQTAVVGRNFCAATQKTTFYFVQPTIFDKRDSAFTAG